MKAADGYFQHAQRTCSGSAVRLATADDGSGDCEISTWVVSATGSQWKLQSSSWEEMPGLSSGPYTRLELRVPGCEEVVEHFLRPCLEKLFNLCRLQPLQRAPLLFAYQGLSKEDFKLEMQQLPPPALPDDMARCFNAYLASTGVESSVLKPTDVIHV
ncbi:unnamed protein product, partial [Chrysoparadoxa australica]